MIVNEDNTWELDDFVNQSDDEVNVIPEEETEEEEVELINISPTSLAELRSFTFGWKKLILAENLGKILNIIKEIS